MWRQVLRENDGRLRLIWRLLGAVVALFGAMMLSDGMGKQAMEAPGGPSFGLALGYALPYMVGTVTAIWLLRRFADRRNWDGMALSLRPGGIGYLLAGTVLGVALVGVLGRLAVLLGWVTPGAVELGTAGLAGAVPGLLVALLIHVPDGVCEELVFRGYWLQNLAERMPVWRATLWIGLVFGALHLTKVRAPLDYAAIMVATLAVSAFLVICRLATGSLWLGIGWHMAFNWTSTHLVALGETERAAFGQGLIPLTTAVPAGPLSLDGRLYLLQTLFLLLGSGALLWWARRAGRPVNWRASLAAGAAADRPRLPEVSPALRHPAARLGMLVLSGLVVLSVTRGVWAANIAGLAAVLLLLWVVERRSPGDIGFGRKGMVRVTLGGFLVGGLAMAAVVGLEWAAGWYRLKSVAPPEGMLFIMLVAMLAQYLVVALGEEALFRGGLFRLVEEWAGSWVALGVSALLFGLLHRQGTLQDSLYVALLGGVFYAVAYMRTRSLWFPIGIHWAWNFVQGPILGLVVSGSSTATDGVIEWGLLRPAVAGPALWTGGRYGPEGGLVAVLICLAVTAVMLWQVVRSGGIRAPQRRSGAVAPGRLTPNF